MQPRTILAVVALAAVAVSLVTSASLPDPSERTVAAAAADEHHAPEAPVAENARLAKLAGEYTWRSTFVTTDGSPPIEAHGDASFTSVLGGRFLEHVERGEMAGATFEARRMWGYNAAAARYEALWVYSGSTAMMNLVGTSSDGGKTVVYDAVYATSAQGGSQRFEIVFEELDLQRFVIRLSHEAPDGRGTGSLKTTYTRRS